MVIRALMLVQAEVRRPGGTTGRTGPAVVVAP
ncbi:hypothetical protein JOF41_003090 [Saccharothrix coeruleofusca]|nr:hypothetical protein [Saccharothrix coeruleofusca]